MFCSKCGAENPDGAAFFSNCGTGHGTPAQPSEARIKGFMASLFDLSFREFVTPRIIGILYLVLLILTGIGAIAIVVTMFTLGPGFGILGLLVLGPLYFFLSIVSYRVMLELVMAIFRMKDELADMHGTIRGPE